MLCVSHRRVGFLELGALLPNAAKHVLLLQQTVQLTQTVERLLLLCLGRCDRLEVVLARDRLGSDELCAETIVQRRLFQR